MELSVEKLTVERLEEVAPKIGDLLETGLYSLSKYLGKFNPDICLRNWKTLVERGLGVVFIVGDVDGFLAAVKTPDINTGELKAVELGWYVKPSKRGIGLKLLRTYIEWAKESGCKAVGVTHMQDVMPQVVKRIYERMGFIHTESSYLMEL